MSELLSQTVGVIVGRFQVPNLHTAHMQLIEYVQRRHMKMIVLLGIPSEYGVSEKNPLPYESRRLMVIDKFPDVLVDYIKDIKIRLDKWIDHGDQIDHKKSDRIWSEHLDATISNIVSSNYTVTVYGGRDSFIDSYSGRFRTEVLGGEGGELISGKDERLNCGLNIIDSPDFRAGVIHGAMNRK